MPILKVRDLAKFGVITDYDAYDLPLGAWSRGKNVRFDDGRVQRAPVFRHAATLASVSPRYVFSTTAAGFDDIFVGYLNGSVKQISSGSETDVSIAAYTPADGEGSYTSTSLARVLYVNREDRVPWALLPETSDFVALANWTSTWRASLFRSFNGSLVALNVTKGGVSFPTMVKTSDFALDGSVPPTWDESDPTNNAYENVIAEMRGDIVDGQALREAFCIYSNRETWLMEATGGTDVYRLRRVFRDAGAINANCSVEIDGQHFVFGTNDIWKHDGLTKVSIADGRVRKFIFGGINAQKSERCFVAHNPEMKEVSFCYVSGDALTTTGFMGGEGCNRAAVYNYADSTWTFDDLPFVFAGDTASVNSALTWANVNATWETIGGSWSSYEDGFKKGLIFVGESSTPHTLSNAIYAFDLYGEGSVFGSAVDENATLGAYLERDGIDLDELNEELRGYKTISEVWPQARIDTDGADLEFAFGAADDYNELPTFTDYMAYDGVGLRKLDYKDAGRYLSMRIRYDDYKTMSLSGLDLNVKVTGRRG